MFDRDHAVVSTDPDAVGRLGGEVRQAVTAWTGPGRIELVASSLGLRVMVGGRALTDAKDLAALDQVGRRCLAGMGG